MSDADAILRWYVALTAVTVALLPLVLALGAGMGSARYGLLRPMGLVLLTALLWWPAAAFGLPFSRLTLALLLVALATAGWTWWWRGGRPRLELPALAAYEGVWLLLFLAYAWFRSYNPDIAGTEKPMEIGLLTSVSRWDTVPAPDVWMAGESINYYYFGYQTIATLVKLSGVPATVAFNLALATLFASTATAAGAAGLRLARLADLGRAGSLALAGLAPVLLLLSGNLETARRLLTSARQTIDAGWWDGVGWQASRVVVDTSVNQPGDVKPTINEFPAFSFVLGDLHPHVLTYPLLAAVVALALGLGDPDSRGYRLRLAVVGGLAGLLYASNSWDAPVGLLVVSGAAALARGRAWRELARDVAVLLAGAVVAAAPFLLQFDAPVGVDNPDVPAGLARLPVLGRLSDTFGIVTWHPSSSRELLLVHGAWIALFALFAAHELWHDRRYLATPRANPHVTLTVALLALGVAIAWAPAVLWLGIPLVLATAIAVHCADPATRTVAGLFAAGFLLALVPEFFYIQDVFADRMNTVFKLYFQAWLLLALASAGAFAVVARRGRAGTRLALIVAGGTIVLATLPYFPLSVDDWTQDFATRQGLDGAAYLARLRPGEWTATMWVADHAEPGDTLVEAPGCAYATVDGVPMNRVASFAGVPTMIGWSNHEGQWRRGQDPAIYSRMQRLRERANAILDGTVPAGEAGARFLVLGRQELAGAATCVDITPRAGDATLQALADAGWTLVFQDGGARVFVPADDPLADELR